MTTGMRQTLKRSAVTLIIVTLGMGLFATGVWAGSARHTSDQPATVQARGSFWNHDLRTGNPTGPTGQRRVAELAATGAHNKEIAGALFISVKTVEANLSRV